MIQNLSAGVASFNKEELTAAARALATSHPEFAQRFMAAALAIRPNSKRLQDKAQVLEGKMNRRARRSDAAAGGTADPAKISARRAEKRAPPAPA